MSFNFKAGGSHSNPFKSPSTPHRKGKSSLFSQAPSTTPAGPPPSYLTGKSTTPAGNPPRSNKIFGSSYNAANNTFGHRNTPGRRGRAFAVPESSPPRDAEEDDEDEDADGEVMDEGYNTQTAQKIPDVTLMSSVGARDSPRGLKRSRTGEVRNQGESGMADIARSFARDHGPAPLNESDDIVLKTDDITSRLDHTLHDAGTAGRDEAVASTASQFGRLWSQYANPKSKFGGIGPDTDAPISKANYIASLMLQLHSPHSAKRTSEASSARSRGALVLPRQSQSSSIPLPRALLDWIDTYHTPFPDEFNEVHLFRPSPAAHESFWDIIGAELLRGHFTRVIRLLNDAGFDNAITAQDDGGRRPGYQGKQLENVEEVVDRYARVLENCPAVKDDDWDVKGAQWSVFRQRVRNSLKALEAFATGSSDDEDTIDASANGEQNIFARSANEANFGSMAAASVRAGSRVPWTVYENLKTMYGVLLGGDEIMDFAQDWVDSSIFFTVWWDGEDGANLNASLAGRNSLRISKGTGAGTREADVSPLTAYRARLGQVFKYVTTEIEEPNFKPDSLDPVQVGLVCVMEDSVEPVVELLQAWDQSIAVAVTDLAALGGWLPQTQPSSQGLLTAGFTRDDLMVLSHGPAGLEDPKKDNTVNRDEILSTYADLLNTKEVFQSSDGKVEREGWELAVSVLDRMDDRAAASAKISDILQTLQFHDEMRVDKVLDLCLGMNLIERAKEIAERYADLLLSDDNTHKAFGLALIYYARAHATQKLKDTTSLLTSLCVLHSAAIPPSDVLDEQLESLLSIERTALVQLARADPEAASLLGAQLSGYATVRQFYNLRDNASRQLKPLERKRKAAEALIGVVESAADCIRGGLFDPAVESVVPVDTLLPLLGEALPLLGEPKRILKKEQIFALMRVVEDFDTAPGRIRERAVDILQGAINAYREREPGGASQQLKKSKGNVSDMSGSGLSGTSSWDIVASSAALQIQGQENGAANEIRRGWDWRKGLDAVAEAEVTGKEVLMLLRMALAQEVAKGWAGGSGW